ncbi:MAG: hypothetical protein FWD60_04435 [Candidatus Azobacteroides sp.]|nr:hypothetical protein [Candidatus Azobacteroides sp.]
MTKKYFFSSIIFVLFSFQMQAQSMFSIKITQVYPSGRIVYSNAYNLSGELDKAEVSLRSQYTGKNANYIMELTRPSGRETKIIQNLTWIRVVNGKKENLTSRPKLEEYYSQPTKVEIYACDNNGSKKEDKGNIVINYDYSFKYIGTGTDKPSYYMSMDRCKIAAKDCFEKNKPKNDSVFFEVQIFRDKNVVDSINNRTEYELFKKALAKKNESTQQKRIEPDISKVISCQDTIKYFDKKLKEAIKKNKPQIQEEAFTVIVNCINIDSAYSWESINKNLTLCQKVAQDYLIEDKLTNLNTIVKKLDDIITMMRKNPYNKPITFNREDYFGTTKVKNIKKGIEELIKINDKLK